MTKSTRRCTVLLVAIVSLLAACTPAPVAEPAAVTATDVVQRISVTGKLLPEIWSGVAAAGAGKVTAVKVGVGDVVAGGDILVQLADTTARSAIDQGEAACQQAEAELARLTAGATAGTITVATAQVQAARTVLSQTVAQRNQLWAGQLDAHTAALDAQIAAAQAEQLVARQQHDETMRCHEVQRPDGVKEEVCPALGTLEERARFALHAANQQVAALEAQKETLAKEHWAQVQVSDAAVETAEQQVAISEAQLAQLMAGPADEEIALAQASIAQAEAALAAAEAALEDTVIRAPFAGTVGAVDVRVGEFATPGVPLITLGDLTTLRVETTDLDEIDVGRIVVGQRANVTFDALPNRTFAGTIMHIAPMANPSGGGVNYRVIVQLTELDPVLRWGMTAFVDIETE